MNIAFTGSRPNKLWGYDLSHYKYKKLAEELIKKLQALMENSKDEKFHFICGGALGFDTIAALTILKMKEIYPNITLEIAIPFKDQPNAWFNKEDVDRYNEINRLADKVTFVDGLDEYIDDKIEIGRYSAKKLMTRNRYMIDNADFVVALYDGQKGGTHNAVNYAKELEKDILIINPKEI